MGQPRKNSIPNLCSQRHFSVIKQGISAGISVSVIEEPHHGKCVSISLLYLSWSTKSKLSVRPAMIAKKS